MTIAEQRPQVETMPTQELARVEALHQLLGTDYDFAEEQGLIDMFVYDPDTQEDGLMHTLAGNIRHADDGKIVAEGFHHEPSASMVESTDTGVDRTHLDGANSKRRKAFAEHPFEPYAAKVEVGGIKKLGVRKDKETGEVSVAEVNNGMYPKEYDPLTVLLAIKRARTDRDVSKDEISQDDSGRRVIVNESWAPLLDGDNMFKIRLVMDAETEKIITAIPFPKPGVMKLSREAVRQFLGDLPDPAEASAELQQFGKTNNPEDLTNL